MRRLKGASLLEAIVAAVLFLTVFAVVMELLPRLAMRDDDAILVAEAEYRVGQVFSKYGTGVWPIGEYTEAYEWGGIAVRIDSYRDLSDLQVVTIVARIDGNHKRIVFKQVVACVP